MSISVGLHQTFFKKPNFKTFYQRFNMHGSITEHRGPPFCKLVHLKKIKLFKYNIY